ncbi:MAG TPA: molybdopterin molybdotransferase MoeA [Candidatus Ozemobacteraceae bacterium]|nr:molybdopterin molybdotransferase MoeA [Candidatus Ozemobacteraceae bacterium]
MTFEEARDHVLGNIPTSSTESVPLGSALGRIPSRDIRSSIDIPPVRIAAMDGFALPDDGDAEGGYPLSRPDAIGAAPVLTGHPVPVWCAAVAPEEECLIEGGLVKPRKRYPPATNIRPAGEDTISGSIVHPAGRPIDAVGLARLASTGAVSVEVYRQPRVLVLTSGNELVRPGEPFTSPAQRYECDSFLLAGLLAEAGVVPSVLPHQPDDPSRIREALATAGAFDLLITCGGAANSEADHTRPVLASLGAEFRFERVRIKPARPTGFALWAGRPVFCLPGNPVAVFVAFHVFVRPCLRALTGLPPVPPPATPVRLAGPFDADGKRLLFVRSLITRDPGGLSARPHPETGSGLLRTLMESDALIPVPPQQSLPAGMIVDPVWLRPEFSSHG